MPSVAKRRWTYDGTQFRRRGAPMSTGTPSGPTPPAGRVTLASIRQPGDSLIQALGRVNTPGTVVEIPDLQTFSGFTMGRGADGKSGYGLFFQNIGGFYLPSPGELQMVANSSTDAATINALPTGSTNNFSYVRIGHSPSQGPNNNPYFSGILRSTGQGSNYNGLQFYYPTNGLIEYAQIYGFPGSSSAPPGETFMINLLNAVNQRILNTLVDGQNIAAAGVGHNNSTGAYTADSIFKNSTFSANVTHYQSSNITYERCTFSKSKNYGANFEKCSGTITIRDCIFSQNPAAEMCVDTDGSSAQVYIYDPQWDTKASGGKFRVKVHELYNYPPPAVSPNGQKTSDIHLILNGVETPSRLQIITT